MKDHKIRELVNQLRDIAIEYHGTGQLREKIARVVRAHMIQAGNSPVHSGLRPEQNIGSPAQSPIDHGNSPVIPDGYVMVPKEPTAQMYDAGDRQMTTKQVWDAMLAAAPQELKGE